MPATCKVLIWCIHNENPFEQDLWWLQCGFVQEIQILNSSMEKHKVTHFRYLIDTLPTKPSLFFSSTPPSNVCPLCPFVFVAPLRYPAPPGKEAFQLYSVSKTILKLYKCINTTNNVNEFRYYITISIQSMHTSHKTSQNERINLQNIRVFVHLWD